MKLKGDPRPVMRPLTESPTLLEVPQPGMEYLTYQGANLQKCV